MSLARLSFAVLAAQLCFACTSLRTSGEAPDVDGMVPEDPGGSSGAGSTTVMLDAGAGAGGTAGAAMDAEVTPACPDSTEACDGVDNDCDDETDEDASCGGALHCVSSECRTCGRNEHCTAEPPTCQQYTCDLGSYACVLSVLPAAPRAACIGSFGDGVCSSSTCVHCIDNNECEDTPARSHCDSNVCRPCADGCARGVACSEDADCAGDECDATADLCTEDCTGSFAIVNTADLNSVRGCSTISGTLTISDETALGSISLPVLESVGALIAECENKPGLISLSLPRLTSIGTDLTVTACSGLTSLSFPMLSTIGNVWIANHPKLASADFAAVTDINGQLTVGYVNELPFPDTRPLWQAAPLATQSATEIGCNVAGDSNCAACSGRSCTPSL